MNKHQHQLNLNWQGVLYSFGLHPLSERRATVNRRANRRHVQRLSAKESFWNVKIKLLYGDTERGNAAQLLLGEATGSHGVYAAPSERLALSRICIPCKSCILKRTISARSRVEEERLWIDSPCKAERQTTRIHLFQMAGSNEKPGMKTNQRSSNT